MKKIQLKWIALNLQQYLICTGDDLANTVIAIFDKHNKVILIHSGYCRVFKQQIIKFVESKNTGIKFDVLIGNSFSADSWDNKIYSKSEVIDAVYETRELQGFDKDGSPVQKHNEAYYFERKQEGVRICTGIYRKSQDGSWQHIADLEDQSEAQNVVDALNKSISHRDEKIVSYSLRKYISPEYDTFSNRELMTAWSNATDQHKAYFNIHPDYNELSWESIYSKVKSEIKQLEKLFL